MAWPGMHAVPPLTLDECLPAEARLVVVAAHPDDEVLACGALLHVHAARGGAVLLVAVTDGEASHAAASRWARQRLAEKRHAERKNGLKYLAPHGIEMPRSDWRARCGAP
jgi:LmbE family N-acetylglucosaminyl deacetylase